MDIKEVLLEKCRRYVDDRIRHAKEAMEQSQEAANEESKSSAGDKYTTDRAMMQIETDKHARQLIEAQKLKRTLDLMQINKKSSHVELGNVVHTDSGTYFIAVSLGKLVVDEKVIFVISAVSPIGQQLIGKQQGDSIKFNGKTITISRVD